MGFTTPTEGMVTGIGGRAGVTPAAKPTEFHTLSFLGRSKEMVVDSQPALGSRDYIEISMGWEAEGRP